MYLYDTTYTYNIQDGSQGESVDHVGTVEEGVYLPSYPGSRHRAPGQVDTHLTIGGRELPARHGAPPRLTIMSQLYVTCAVSAQHVATYHAKWCKMGYSYQDDGAPYPTVAASANAGQQHSNCYATQEAAVLHGNEAIACIYK